jgi:hypothetical protein
MLFKEVDNMKSILIFYIWTVGLLAALAGIYLYYEECPEMGLVAFLIAGCDFIAVNALLVSRIL